MPEPDFDNNDPDVSDFSFDFDPTSFDFDPMADTGTGVGSVSDTVDNFSLSDPGNAVNEDFGGLNDVFSAQSINTGATNAPATTAAKASPAISINPVGVIAGIATGNPLVGMLVGAISGKMGVPDVEIPLPDFLNPQNLQTPQNAQQPAGQIPDFSKSPFSEAVGSLFGNLGAQTGGGGGETSPAITRDSEIDASATKTSGVTSGQPKSTEAAKTREKKTALAETSPIQQDFAEFFQMPEFVLLPDSFGTIGGKPLAVSRSTLEGIFEKRANKETK